MDNNVLRIELKLIKTVELKKIGVSTFADINSQTLNKAKDLLIKRFDEVMHYDDTIDKSKLSNRRKGLIKSYSNPRFWIDEVKPRYRDRHKKRLNEITHNYSENLHLQIRQDIIDKCVIINRLTEPSRCVAINTSNIELNITHLDNRKCLITGIDISMQKEHSFLLSHTGLKHLYKTNRSLYEDIKKKHLSEHWVDVDLDIEIREIAHNIRDTIRCQRTKQERLYPKHQLHLFNIAV